MALYDSTRKAHFVMLVGALFAALLVPMEFGLRVYQDARTSDNVRISLEHANRLRVLLESETNTAAFLATGVESYIVARRGVLNHDEMQRILALIFDRSRHFRNIGVAPDNQIAWIFPLASNEAAIGLKYEGLPEQWPAIERMMQTGQSKLSGPIDLVQGGRGLVYRVPVFIDDEYWGLLSTVIDVDSLFGLLHSVSGDLAPLLAIKSLDREGNSVRVIYGDADYFNEPLDTLPVRLPGAEWQMAVQLPEGAKNDISWYRFFGVVLVLLIAVLLGVFFRLVWQRNMLDKLDSEVTARTAALQQSNELLDSVLAAARSFAIIATDTAGNIMLFNKGAEQMLGYPAEQVVGKQKVSNFLLEDELRERALKLAAEIGRPLVDDEVFTLRANQGVEEVVMLHYQHHDGRLVPVQVVVSAIRSSSGSVRGYLGIAEDVSERLHNESLKNQFISTVSHELRTPLTAISGALALVKSGAAGAISDGAQPMLEIAVNNSRRLSQLVNDLLDIEKLMAGRMALYLDTHAVADLVHSTIADLSSVAAQQHVELVESLKVEAFIRVDASRFQQVLTNLISNAIKFSPEGGKVEIAVSRDSGHIRITVLDQGPGIPPSFRPHIFQRFAQADGRDNRRSAGTGLGLAISKELTEQMGGQIGFDLDRQQGSCFWLEFIECEQPVTGGPDV